MSDPRHALGRRAEEVVAAWLEDGGWTVLARRVRSREGGEVDIVALDPDRTLVAVEVRARRTTRAGAAAVSVDRRRVQRLERTLVAFARSHPGPHSGLRVDLVTVEPLAESWRVRRVASIGSW
jgi:putative endonuclease